MKRGRLNAASCDARSACTCLQYIGTQDTLAQRVLYLLRIGKSRDSRRETDFFFRTRAFFPMVNMMLDDLPNDVIERIVGSLDHVNALINFYSTTKDRRLTVTPNAKVLSMLQMRFDYHLEKLPKPVKEVLATMPKLNSLRVTRTFWTTYMRDLLKAGLFDGTFAEAWDTAYKMHATFFEETKDLMPGGASYYWDNGPGDPCGPLFLKVDSLPEIHADVIRHFIYNFHQRSHSLEHLNLMFNGEARITIFGEPNYDQKRFYLDLLESRLNRKRRRS